MKVNKKIILTFVAIIAVIALFIFIFNQPRDIDHGAEELGIPTKLVKAEDSELVDVITYMGTFSGREEIAVSPQITSDLLWLNVEEGEHVKRGEEIAQLDDARQTATINTLEYQIETQQGQHDYVKEKVEAFYRDNPNVKRLEDAKSNYKHLSNELERYEALYESGAISEQHYEEVKHEKENAAKKIEELEALVGDTYDELKQEKDIARKKLGELNSKLQELRLELDEAIVEAPISGKIKDLRYSQGELVAAGKPLAIIEDVEEHIATVNVAESDLKNLSEGTEAVVSPTHVDIEKDGQIIDISTSLDPRTRMGKVEVGLAETEEDSELYVGSSVKVDFIIETASGVVIPSREAIKKLADKEVVYVYEDGKVIEREVKTGLTVGNRVQVLEGLNPGEKIAVQNIDQLYDNAKVYIFEGEENE